MEPHDRQADAEFAARMAAMDRMLQDMQARHAELQAMIARMDARARLERGEDGFDG